MHIRPPPDRNRRKEIPPRPASKNPAGKLAAIPAARTPAMHQAAAALLAAALLFALAAAEAAQNPRRLTSPAGRNRTPKPPPKRNTTGP